MREYCHLQSSSARRKDSKVLSGSGGGGEERSCCRSMKKRTYKKKILSIESPKLSSFFETNVWYCLFVESKKWYKWTYSQNRNRVTDVENKFMVTKGEEGRDKLGDLDLYMHTNIK